MLSVRCGTVGACLFTVILTVHGELPANFPSRYPHPPCARPCADRATCCPSQLSCKWISRVELRSHVAARARLVRGSAATNAKRAQPRAE